MMDNKSKNLEDVLEYNFIPVKKELTSFEKKLMKLEQIRYIHHPGTFHKETAFQNYIDNKESYFSKFNKIRMSWHSQGSGYLTHAFSKYQGSFYAQMIRGLINFCNLSPGSCLLDPFCGSGTALIEANLLTFDAIGIDINPYGSILSKLKTEVLHGSYESIIEDNKRYFESQYYDTYIQMDFNKIINRNIQELFYYHIYLECLKQQASNSTNLGKVFQSNFNQRIKVLREFYQLNESLDLKVGTSKILFGDTLSILKFFVPEIADIIITSPPYSDLLDYIENDFILNSQFFRHDFLSRLKQDSVGFSYQNPQITEHMYYIRVDRLFQELYCILKPKRYCILIYGDLPNMHEMYLHLAKLNNFQVQKSFINEMVNKKRRKNYEHILILFKE